MCLKNVQISDHHLIFFFLSFSRVILEDDARRGLPGSARETKQEEGLKKKTGGLPGKMGSVVGYAASVRGLPSSADQMKQREVKF